MSANVTEVDYWAPSLTDKVIITVIFGIILLTGIVGNVLVILLLFLVRKMHSVVNLCLGCLAVADLIVLVFLPIFPLYIMYDKPIASLGKGFCVFLGAIDRGAMVSSVLIFLLIGVERYTVLVHPLKSIGMWTYKRVSLLLVIIWVVTVGLCVPFGYVTRYGGVFNNSTNTSETKCYVVNTDWLRVYEVTIYALLLFLPIPMLVVLYGKIIFVLRKQRIPGSVNSDKSALTARRSRSQTSMLLAVVVGLFAVCILPFRVYLLLLDFSPEVLQSFDYQLLYALTWLGRLMLYLNHASNPVVYFLMSENFREAFRVVFCKECGKRSSGVRRG